MSRLSGDEHEEPQGTGNRRNWNPLAIHDELSHTHTHTEAKGNSIPDPDSASGIFNHCPKIEDFEE